MFANNPDLSFNLQQKKELVKFMLNPAEWIDQSHKQSFANDLPEKFLEHYWGKPQFSKLIEQKFELPEFSEVSLTDLPQLPIKLAISPTHLFIEVLIFVSVTKLSDSLKKIIDKKQLDKAQESFGSVALGFARNTENQTAICEAMEIESINQTKFSNQDKLWAISTGLDLFWKAVPNLDDAFKQRIMLKLGNKLESVSTDTWEFDNQQALKFIETVINNHFGSETCLQ